MGQAFRMHPEVHGGEVGNLHTLGAMVSPDLSYERGLLYAFVDYDATPPWLNEPVDPMDDEGDVYSFPMLPDPTSRGQDSANRLASREREVAALVARGLTNRQIAEALVVSQRTAESHVATSLSKLGLASRAQLAARASGRGLVASEGVSPF
jgi:DNA-binding CsgD family transcriptional regulator